MFMEGNLEAIPLLLDAVWDVSLAKHIQGELPELLLAARILIMNITQVE